MPSRERHRADVRRRIEEAAYRLFSEHGYSRTTTAEVAAEAGISARTLFRYFPAKADLLFGEAARHSGVLLRAVEARPPREAALPAALAAVRELARELDAESTPARAAIARAEPGVRKQALDVLSCWIDELADALSLRLHGDREAARVVATTVLHLLDEAVAAWAAEGAEPGALPAMVDRLGAALMPQAGSRPGGQ